MRTAAFVTAGLLAGLLGCSHARDHRGPQALPPSPDTKFIVTEQAAAPLVQAVTARHGYTARVDARGQTPEGSLAILEVQDRDLADVSAAMHAQFARCAGFATYDTFHEALAALHPAAEQPAIDYTLTQEPLVRALIPRVDATAIKATIAELSAMKNRYYRSESGAAASAWLLHRWTEYARERPDVTFELFDQGYPQKSVLMTIPGSTKADEVVVIGGHLDSIAMGGLASDAPGADDDASGIATLSEVARVLLQSNYRPERTLKFIAYAAEEVGLRGSLAVVKELKRRGTHVVGALQLDMTNYQGSDRDIWIIDDFTSKAQNGFLVQLIETYTDATWGSDKCGYACSDHAAWHQAGVPVSMPFEARFKDHNHRIHTNGDTLEQSKGNALHAAKFARLAAAYAIELGKGTIGGAPTAGRHHVTEVREVLLLAPHVRSPHHHCACACAHDEHPGRRYHHGLVALLALLGLGLATLLFKRFRSHAPVAEDPNGNPPAAAHPDPTDPPA